MNKSCPELLEARFAICRSCPRHCVPVVQLLFLRQLGQDLAEQLDNDWKRWQANVPPSDSQLRKFPRLSNSTFYRTITVIL